MYINFTSTEIYVLIAAVIVVPIIVSLFELIIIGSIDFVKTWVSKVKKIRVVNGDSEKGTYTLYDKYISKIRKDVFRNNEHRK